MAKLKHSLFFAVALTWAFTACAQRESELTRLEQKLKAEREQLEGSKLAPPEIRNYVAAGKGQIEAAAAGVTKVDRVGRIKATVTLLPNGTVERVDFEAPAAVVTLRSLVSQIVNAAGPFQSFSPEMSDIDKLQVTRTWVFRPTGLYLE